jgi:archaellum component FlaC
MAQKQDKTIADLENKVTRTENQLSFEKEEHNKTKKELEKLKAELDQLKRSEKDTISQKMALDNLTLDFNTLRKSEQEAQAKLAHQVVENNNLTQK